MSSLRIRWTVAAKVAGVVLGAIVALSVLPGLLRAPKPPPLERDIGLPRAAAASTPHRRGAFVPHVGKKSPPPRLERTKHARRPRSTPPKAQAAPVEAVAPEPSPPPEPASSPEPAPAPEAAPVSEPPPPPESSPSPPVEDGSAEFAPH